MSGVPATHEVAEQWPTLDGYTVRCDCGTLFPRSTRTQALADHEGHWNAARVRRMALGHKPECCDTAGADGDCEQDQQKEND